MAYILRGLPGSGKSTLAKSFVSGSGIILSTDDFFVDKTTGQYNFNSKSLPKAHYWNQLRAEAAMKKGISPVIIDNTNLQAWEAKPYIEYAIENDYHIEIKEPETSWKANSEELAKKNTHHIPPEAIIQMLAQKEDFTIQGALKSTPPSNYQLNERDKKKVEHSLFEQDEPEESSSQKQGPSSLRYKELW